MCRNLALCPGRQGPVQGGPSRPDRAPQGWYRSRTGAHGSQYVRLPDTTHSSPPGASGARSAVSGTLLEQSGTPLGSTPVLPTLVPTQYTHPGTPQAPPHVTAARVHHGHRVTGTCTYDRFQTVQGEPRGIRTHPVFRVPGPYLVVYEVCTAV